MFRKLVSNLAFSPGVTNQLRFYARRLRREDLTRKLSMFFGISLVAFQLMAVLNPATSVNADGPNDVLNGGFSSKEQLIQLLDRNTPESIGAKSLYNHLGITPDRIRAASAVRTIDASRNTKLSFGRHRVHPSDGSITVDLLGNTFFYRPLNTNLRAGVTTARVIEGTTTRGTYFAVLLDCGNPLVDSLPPAPAAPPVPVVPKTPSLTITKTTLTGSPQAGVTVRPGDTLGYRIYFSNVGNGDATNVFVEDSIPDGTTFTLPQGSGGTAKYGYTNSPYPGHDTTPHVYWAYEKMPAGAKNYYVDFYVKVNTNATNGQTICNTAFIRSVETPQIPSKEKICHYVQVNAAIPPATPETPPPVVNIPVAPTTPPVTTPVVSPSIQLSKSAAYLKRNGATPTQATDANGTTAAAGDVIEYTLKVLNSGTGDQAGQAINDDIHDILEYADVTNTGGGTVTAGSISWGTATIPAHTTVTKVFQVTVKSPIPPTPRSSSDPVSYDLQMDNLFSNKISIKVIAPTAAKQIEVASQTLPETGAGTNLFIACFGAALLVFFYSRNRQLVHEVAILTVDHNPGV